MDIVVNASPLILLCKAGHIRLLEKLGRNVFVPIAVLNEVEAYPSDEAGRLVRSLSWLKQVIVAVPDSIKSQILRPQTADYRPQTLRRRPQTAGYRHFRRLCRGDYRLQTADCRLSCNGCGDRPRRGLKRSAVCSLRSSVFSRSPRSTVCGLLQRGGRTCT